MNANTRSWLASLAAAAGAAAASLCCLPILPLTLAASGAGAAWLTASKLQPCLIGLSALCVAFGFLQASRAGRCGVGRRGLNFALLSLSALLALGVALFPQAIANRLASGPAEAAADAGSPRQAIALTSARQLRDAFNAAPAAAVKIVALYSPT